MRQKAFLVYLFLFLTISISFAQKSYHTYFEECGVEGSTTVYDYKDKRWIFTDSLDAKFETLPASTFKILNSLVALEMGGVRDTQQVMRWDGTDHQLFGNSYPVWNKDTNLREAYKNSTIWFYVNIADRVGRKKYRKLFRKIKYGNGNLNEQGTDFWNYGSFAISPKNQIDFLVKLYENRLPFSQKNMDTIKDVMLSGEDEMGAFRDKTGWTVEDGDNIGWWIGYVITGDNVYFFATRIIQDVNAENQNFAVCRKEITKKILKDIIRSNGFSSDLHPSPM